MEYQTENNIKKTEMITIVNECAYEKENLEVNHVTEIKEENSSFNSTYINNENNHIEFESVVIKMEGEDQYFEENVENSFDIPLINKDEITTAINQNDIHLTASAIMEENINQARDSVNDNMQIKVEENYDYSLYSEKCAYDPLVNQDEIKIDIVEYDIDSVNGERNNEYKIEHIEEFSKEHVIPLESEDKTDKEVNVSYKILKAKHEKTLHSGEKPHECNVCQKKFRYPSNLKEHMGIHTGEYPYKCDECQKKFGYSSTLRKHMRIHTGEKPHECDICQKKFTQLSNLMCHKRSHTGEKPYACDVCQKKFTKLSVLMCHKRIHTGEKPYTCDVCEKKFTHSSSLMYHKRIHTGEKPHACDVCQRKFSHLPSLMCHKRIHTGEKPYECDVCFKKFTQSSNLMYHKRIHTGEKSY